jgi:hypothetical protein
MLTWRVHSQASLVELRGVKPEGAPHTPWQLLEHIRIAQWDILEFSKSGKHKSPKWPDEYWPKTAAPPTDKAWDKSVKQVMADLDAICDLVRDPKHDLTAQLPHGDGQTLLREVLLVADHNSYHLGQLVMVRRILRTGIEEFLASRLSFDLSGNRWDAQKAIQRAMKTAAMTAKPPSS